MMPQPLRPARAGRWILAAMLLIAPAAPAAAAALTAEEQRLLEAGLLPSSYPPLAAALAEGGPEAALALGRRGFDGPFSADFGDPRAMLAAARYAADHPAYAAFLKGLRRGDVVFVADADPNDLVARLSGGPFCHMLLCTDPEPPGRFLEAVGITGQPGETTGDRVRRASASRYATPAIALRVTHPAAGRPEVVDSAIAWAGAQLGKPYNYTFSDALGGERAYYCSSYLLTAFRQAGLDWRPVKAPERDRLPMALSRTLNALGPDDPLALSVETMTFLHRLPAPTDAALAAFVAERIAPRCRVTRALAASPDQRRRLAAVLAGWLTRRRAPGPLEAYTALVEEARVPPAAVARVAVTAAGAAWPYMDVLAALAFGRRSAIATATAGLLDGVDALGAPGWGRAPWRASEDLVSPTDLAWSLREYEDYGTLPGVPLDPPWPHGLVRGRRGP